MIQEVGGLYGVSERGGLNSLAEQVMHETPRGEILSVKCTHSSFLDAHLSNLSLQLYSSHYRLRL